ncbi:MAG: S-layer homology domain-containing protein [Sedimentibacter sp.]|uniref:S-layer homology domain-containing protein n=1 Tax=Sedimentibacter sp. TaxID=1960295 RepID=UPI0029816575|nr:S-layer homology domain-containing protein [Sedimentibacter sp.]MDW5298810.1 S-layer homology domain-containing protein [Sedimentibacter sp.]
MTNALLEKAQDTYGDGKGDLIEVRVDTPASTEQLTFNISQSELAKIADETSADFGISSPFISIVFDGKAIDIISEVDSDGKVLITATKIANMNGRPVYDLTVMNGKTQVSDFKGGHATVTIPYELKLGENPNAVVIYYLADDGTFKAVRGHYDVSLKAVVFKTTHFSKFVIGYNPVSFNDVASDAWYKNAVDFIAARGITSGTGDNMYSPEEKLTRAQFVVLMMNAYQINTQNQGVSNQIQNFSDAGNAYYTDYLLTAKALSIVNGVGSNMFAPEQVISRQEMFVILYNALDVIEELPQASSDKQLIDFGDVNQMASWAQEAMSALIEGGVISGSNGMLNPKVSTTRAEIAQMLYNLLSK